MSHIVKLRDEAPLSLDAPIEGRSPGTIVPLTAIQRQLLNYYIKERIPRTVRMCAGTTRLSGHLDVCLLERCIETAIRRHESLRTRVVTIDGVPRQHIDEPREHRLKTQDLSRISERSAPEEIRRCIQDFLEQEVDLGSDPLFDAQLIKVSHLEHVLVLGLHHMVGDGKSNGILNREIWELYNRGTQGQTLSLSAPPLQFSDYAVWQERTFHSWHERHAPYWKARLAGIPRVRLFSDEADPKAQPSAGAMLHFHLGKAVTSRLSDISQRQETVLPLTILAVYVIVTSRWCQQKDLTVGFVVHGRYGRPELADMIGFLATILYLRIDVNPVMTFLDLLEELRREFAAANRHIDFDRVPDLIPDFLTEAWFNWLPYRTARNSRHPESAAGGTLKIEPFAYNSLEPVKFAPFFYDSAAGAGVTVHFRADLPLRQVVETFGRNFQLVAGEAARDPYVHLALLAHQMD